jgi:hypothetical protein
LTPQFRNLLLAPDSGEEHHHRKPSASPPSSQKDQPNEDNKDDAYTAYKNEYGGTIMLDELTLLRCLGLPQAHIDQLLRYYGKIAGKLLPQGYTKFRKITAEKDKDKQDEPGR